MIITGTGSGLGRYLLEVLGGTGWTRDLDPAERDALKQRGTDIIIHCAARARLPQGIEDLHGYLADNVLLTREMVGIPHRTCILLSTVDVYPSRPVPHTEDERIDPNAVRGLYAMTKLMSEAIVRARASRWLILRCSALLGPHIRKNSVVRMLEDDPCRLGLAPDSRLNYVLHEDVAEFIRMAIQHDLEGTYNVASTASVTLEELARIVGRRVEFGGHRYDAGEIDTRKLVAICPRFRKTSRDVVRQFIEARATAAGQPCGIPGAAEGR